VNRKDLNKQLLYIGIIVRMLCIASITLIASIFTAILTGIIIHMDVIDKLFVGHFISWGISIYIGYMSIDKFIEEINNWIKGV